MRRFSRAALIALAAALPFMTGMANGQVAPKRAGDFALLDHKGYFHHMAWYDNNRAVVFLVHTNSSQAARAAVLASLGTVDLVVVFEEDTPLELIQALQPAVLVKGADYRLDQVVGADLVKGWGGRVLLAELSPGHSTTSTIRKMAR